MAGEWVVKLGAEHGARERAAALADRAARDELVERGSLALERWTHIVAAMTHLVRAYNGGFDREVLSLAEDRAVPNRPTVTIRAGGEGSASLQATLDGTLICVRSRNDEGLSRETEQLLRPDRTDDQTAAYVLQHWMERL